MPPLSRTDRLVLQAANLWSMVRHPRLTESFRRRLHRLPHFATPIGHAELVQWRKVFDHDPRFVIFSDKLATKRWAAEICPDLSTAEVFWSGTRPEDIPEALIAPGYVIKASHGCHMNYFPGQQSLPRPQLNRLLRKWLAGPYNRQAQWAYLKVPRRLFVERRIGSGGPPLEFTFRCHDGVVSTSYIAIGQHWEGERTARFDGDNRRLPPKPGLPESQQLPNDYELPPSFFAAMAFARRLSRGLDHIRVDTIIDGDIVYLCELTVYPSSGFGGEIQSHNAEMIERAWLAAIDKSWFLSTPQPWPLRLYAQAFRHWLSWRRG